MDGIFDSLPINDLITTLMWLMKIFEEYLLKILNAITGNNFSWEEWSNIFG
ncbi:MAG TPA: hypothetical protein GXZ23_00625 [Clostridiales bacterium]|jgi:hypothetical protein|nr:hypothetical protein [Clostridiales bacterium]